MILFSDLHLRPESAETCFAVLEQVRSLALSGDRRVGFLGDLWHVRYALPVDLLNRLDDVLEGWTDDGITATFLVGNHDQCDVAGNNGLSVLERHYDEGSIRVYSKPTEDEHGLWLPYRKDIAPLAKAIEATKAKVCFTHHGLVGARMNSGVIAGELDGLPPALFQKFVWAFFGHWHEHQQLGNCVYVGSPWQTRADEIGQAKGVLELQRAAQQWRHIPLDVGPRYIRAQAGENIQARPGDIVRAAHDIAPEAVEKLRASGAEVFVEPPPQAVATARLGLPAGASLREYAQRSVESVDGALHVDRLMKLFDEVVQ